MPGPTVTEAVVGTAATVAANRTGEPVSPVAVAVMVSTPVAPPAVSEAWASPPAPAADLAGATTVTPWSETHATVSPATPFPNWSLIFTTRGAANAEPVTAVWLLPLATASCVAAPGVPVAVNVTGDPVAPASVAVADWVPAV